MTLINRTAAVLATFVAIIAVPPAYSPVHAEEALSAEQKKAVEGVVQDYLLQNPEVIIDAIREMQRRDEAAQASQQQSNLAEFRDALENNPADPVIGNPNGDITVVEFFDYRCGYCKKVFPDVQTLLREDGNIKYVLKEWPILGDDSVYASRAAISVWQGQRDLYADFHTAMMTNRGSLSNDRVHELAGESGVDVEKMKAGMKSAEVDSLLTVNRMLADGLNITGTPGFVFGSQVVPGAADLETLRQLVAAMRGHKP